MPQPDPAGSPQARFGLPCTRPWTSLEERSLAGKYKVCCEIESAMGRLDKNSPEDIMALWNSPETVRVRQAMVDGDPSEFCPPACPLLRRMVSHGYSDFMDYSPEEYQSFSAEFKANRTRVMESIRLRQVKVDTFPLRAKFFPSNRCTLDCKMCPIDRGPNAIKPGPNYFAKISRLLPYVEEFLLYGGDPFACSVTKGILFDGELSRYPQLRFSTSTNAVLLDEPTQRKLSPLKMHLIVLSLDACTERTYEAIRLKGKFRQTLANVRGLIAKRASGELSIRYLLAGFVVQMANYHEIPAFLDWAGQAGITTAFSLIEPGLGVGAGPELRKVLQRLEQGIKLSEDGGNRFAQEELTHILNRLATENRA